MREILEKSRSFEKSADGYILRTRLGLDPEYQGKAKALGYNVTEGKGKEGKTYYAEVQHVVNPPETVDQFLERLGEKTCYEYLLDSWVLAQHEVYRADMRSQIYGPPTRQQCKALLTSMEVYGIDTSLLTEEQRNDVEFLKEYLRNNQ